MIRARGVIQKIIIIIIKIKKVGKKQNGKKNKAKVAEPEESVLEKELGRHGVMKRGGP